MAKRQIDPKAPDAQVRVTDFGGMSPGTDQHDNDPGMSYFQVNVVPFYPGELRARRGFVVVRFEDTPGQEPPAPMVLSAVAETLIDVHPESWHARETDNRAWTDILLSQSADSVGPQVFPLSATSELITLTVMASTPPVISKSAESTILATARAVTVGAKLVSAASSIVAHPSSYRTGSQSVSAASSIVAAPVADRPGDGGSMTLLL